MGTRSSQQNSNADGEETHETPTLAEKLWTVGGGRWSESEYFWYRYWYAARAPSVDGHTPMCIYRALIDLGSY